MGTRGLVIVKNGKKEVSLYNHMDSYSEGLGEDLKEFFKGINLESFKSKFAIIETSKSEKYYIGRAIQVLDSILESDLSEPLVVHDSPNYQKGSTDCEWYYVVDLEKLTIKTYKVQGMFSESSKGILKDTYTFNNTEGV